MDSKILKRVFKMGDFQLKIDPNSWTKSDVEHLTKVIARKVKFNEIQTLEFKGVWLGSTQCMNKEDVRDGAHMRFEITLGTNKSKHLKNETLERLQYQLIMECL